MSSINDQDLDILFKDLSEVDEVGYVGILSIFGPNAFPIIAGKHYRDNSLRHALAAGARLGDGRLVIFAHTGYLNPTTHELGTLVTNSIRWSAGGGDQAKTEIKVALYPGLKELSTYYEGEPKYAITIKNVREEDLNNLEAFDVLVLNDVTNIKSFSAQIESIKKFVKSGGGFVATSTGWNYKADVKLHPGNQITREAGLGWTTDNSLKPIEDGATKFSTDRKNLRLIHCTEAWSQLMAHLEKSITLPDEDLNQINAVIAQALSSIPDDDPFVENVQRDFVKHFPKLQYPSVENPVNDPITKLALGINTKLFISECFETCDVIDAAEARKAASLFPGLVDLDVERIKDYEVTLDINADGWYSTGVYAPPWEQITIQFLPEGITAKSEYLYVQIGCHSDDITRVGKWTRCPTLLNTKKLNPTDSTITATNIFGGLIYIKLAQKTNVGKMTLKITGGVLAPYFKLGVTTKEEWNNTIRYYKTPFGEIQSNKMILTLPSDRLSKLEYPEELLVYWDTVMDTFADFVGIPAEERERPFRFVGDLQISTGLMHSGYPLMMHLDENIDTALSLPRMKSGDAWGHYHEIGHSHQDRDWWTFRETMEVTNNIMVLYVYETLLGISPAEARPDRFTPENRKDLVMGYVKAIEAGKNYKDYWPSNPFSALCMYLQLKEMFGWDAYKNVFRAFREKATTDKPPVNDAGKIDAWMVIFSKTVGQYLVPLFDSWAVTVSDAARKLVEDLPKTDQTILSPIQ